MVLILTDRFDAHANRVIEKLHALKISYFRLNLDKESLEHTLVRFENKIWEIATQEASITSAEISCVWLRKFFVELNLEQKLEVQASIDFKIWRNEFNATLLGLYTALKHLPWLNPISQAVKGDNKYYQMQLVKTLDIAMPKTIVSNEKSKLIEFAKNCNDDVVLKLLNQDMYDFDKNNKLQGIYTNRITSKDLASFAPNGENPIMLQEYVKKAYEVRWSVVGKRHFVCKIESQQSKVACEDWRRYDLANTPHTAIKPPFVMQQRVEKLLEIMELEYGALDFIVTPQNEWIFLEINCCGQWLWIEDLTGLDISGGITEWLQKHYTKHNTTSKGKLQD